MIRATHRARRTGAREQGVAAETLAAKWFDKNLALSRRAEPRPAAAVARDRDRALHGARLDTPFGLYAGAYREQQARGAALGLNPLVASYGPALLDRAIARCARARDSACSFPEMVSQQPRSASRASDLTPDLAGFDIGAFLGGLRMAPSIEVRHTVGLVDPIIAGDQKPGERVDDGLPETLEEVVRHYRGRYYKLKVGGNVAADLERLPGIAAVLDRALAEYRATLDGNEQYESVEGIAELWRRMRETPALSDWSTPSCSSSSRSSAQVALSRPVAALARREAAR